MGNALLMGKKPLANDLLYNKIFLQNDEIVKLKK